MAVASSFIFHTEDVAIGCGQLEVVSVKNDFPKNKKKKNTLKKSLNISQTATAA